MQLRQIILAVLLVLLAIPEVSAQMRSTRIALDKPGVHRERVDIKSRAATAAAPESIVMSADEVAKLPVDEQADIEPCPGTGQDADLPIGWKPTRRDPKLAKCFWGQKGAEWLKTTELTGSGGSATAATEILSDFVYGVRLSFSTAVASSDEDDDENGEDGEGTASLETDNDDIQKNLNLLRANGGNVALSAAYPLYVKPYSAGNFVAMSYGRLAGTFAPFGDTGSASENLDWSELNGNSELAVTTRTGLRTVNGTFNVELYTNTGVIGGTKLFRQGLGTNKSVFLHGEAGANIKLGTLMTVGASWNWYSADGIPSGATFVVGFGL